VTDSFYDHPYTNLGRLLLNQINENPLDAPDEWEHIKYYLEKAFLNTSFIKKIFIPFLYGLGVKGLQSLLLEAFIYIGEVKFSNYLMKNLSLWLKLS